MEIIDFNVEHRWAIMENNVEYGDRVTEACCTAVSPVWLMNIGEWQLKKGDRYTSLRDKGHCVISMFPKQL